MIRKPNKLYKLQVKRHYAVTRERGCGKKRCGVRKGYRRQTISLTIMKPNNWGLLEKGTVCIYDDKPLSYIKLVTYCKASASSLLKTNLPRPLCIQMAAKYHSFLYIRMISEPCILAQLATSWAYLTNLLVNCVRLKDEVRSLFWHSVGPLAHITFLDFNWSWNTSYESPGITGNLQPGFCETNSPRKRWTVYWYQRRTVHLAHGSLADGFTMILHNTLQVCDVQTAASVCIQFSGIWNTAQDS